MTVKHSRLYPNTIFIIPANSAKVADEIIARTAAADERPNKTAESVLDIGDHLRAFNSVKRNYVDVILVNKKTFELKILRKEVKRVYWQKCYLRLIRYVDVITKKS